MGIKTMKPPSNKIYGLGSVNGIDLQQRAEDLYLKDGLWNSLPKEERERLENNDRFRKDQSEENRQIRGTSN